MAGRYSMDLRFFRIERSKTGFTGSGVGGGSHIAIIMYQLPREKLSP